MQLSQRLTERDWRWRCERWYEVSLSGGAVQLFFIDTSPFLQQYWDVPWASNPGELCSPAAQPARPCCTATPAALARMHAPARLLHAYHVSRTLQPGLICVSPGWLLKHYSHCLACKRHAVRSLAGPGAEGQVLEARPACMQASTKLTMLRCQASCTQGLYAAATSISSALQVASCPSPGRPRC